MKEIKANNFKVVGVENKKDIDKVESYLRKGYKLANVSTNERIIVYVLAK